MVKQYRRRLLRGATAAGFLPVTALGAGEVAEPAASFRGQEGSSPFNVFRQLGEGAVERSLRDKSQDFRSLFDFIPPAQHAAIRAGRPTQDSSRFINKAIESREGFFLERGVYSVEETITYPSDRPPSGMHLRGAGRSVSDVFRSSRSGSATILRWDGSEGGVLIRIPSAVGLVFESITLVGKSSQASKNDAAALMLISGVAGFGSGTHSFARLDFQHARVGVQVMEDSGDVNGDTCGFEHVLFSNCDTGFLAKNNQALCFQFTNLYATKCRNVINMERGGHLGINMANFNECGGGDSKKDYCIRVQSAGANAHNGTFLMIRVENSTRGMAQLGGYGRFKFIGYAEGQANQRARMFDIDGPSVTFEACRFLTQDSNERPFRLKKDAGGRRSAIVFRDCNFVTPALNFAEWFEVELNTYPLVRVDACTTGPVDEPTSDFATQPEWGTVIQYGRTTNDLARRLSVDGRSAVENRNALVIASDTAWLFEVMVLGKQIDGGIFASFRRRVSVVNNAGLVSITHVESIGTDHNPGAWSCRFTNIGPMLSAEVTGASGTAVDWRAAFTGCRV